MKAYILTSLAAATLLLVGCGGGSSSSTSSGAQTSTTGTSIQVVRGPILGAIVRDNNGTGAVASSDGNGTYTFKNNITYPIVATGGVIDMDRDGKVSVGDVKNDMNLSSTSGSVVTVATTYASKPETKALMESVASSLGITTKDLETKTPLNSKEIEAISNVLYKYKQENNISTQTLGTIKTDIQTEHEKYIQAGTSHDSKSTEIALADKLSQESKVHKLQTATEVDTEVTSINNEYSKTYKEANTQYERENGDMEYGENGSGTSSHSQGVSCASCHSFVNGTITPRELEGIEGEGNAFTSGATIFTKLHATGGSGVNGAGNYKIRLRLENNTTVTYNSGRGTGNVNGTFDSTAIGKYTAEVLNASGVVTNKSLTNSHDTTRLDCNSCHTATGSSVGSSATAPGRIVSFDYYGTLTTVSNVVTAAPTTSGTTGSTTGTSGTTTPTTPTTPTPTVTKSFASDVLPILTRYCSGCHSSSGSSRQFLYSSTSSTYASVMKRINTTTPTASRLLQKGSGQVGHYGGNALRTSANYTTLQTWISEGAKNN